MKKVETCVGKTSEIIKAAQAIRKIIFVDEQNVPQERDLDGLDDKATHYLVLDEGKPIATARTRITGIDDRLSYKHNVKIERVGVMQEYRGLHIGHLLMQDILRDYKMNPMVKAATLEAQTRVVGFYENIGFETIGSNFDDAGIEHITMYCSLRKDESNIIGKEKAAQAAKAD